MPEKAPAFQMYAKEVLSDDKFMSMTMEERGIYWTALCVDWSNDGIRESILEGWLKGGCPLVRECFQPIANRPGYLTNPRLQKEREKQAAWREKSRQGGIKSAKSRASKSEGWLKGGCEMVEPKANSASASASASPKGGEIAHAREEVACVNAREIPSLEQVQAYFANAGAPADWAQSFFDHYDAVGWARNGSPITRWQSQASKWINDNRSGRAPGKQAETNGRRGGGVDF